MHYSVSIAAPVQSQPEENSQTLGSIQGNESEDEVKVPSLSPHDEVDAHDPHDNDGVDEYSSLLRRTQDELPTYFREKPELFKMSQTIINSNYALLFLGLSEFVVSFLAGASGFVGSYAMYLLGSFGLFIGALSMISNSAIKVLETDVKRAMEMLAFYFNLGSLLLISFASWAITVLVMSSLFWKYVNLHWNGNVERSFPGFTAGEAETHVQLTVLSVGILSFFSSILLVVSLRGVAMIQAQPIVDEQLYLWVNLMLGMSGSLLMGITIFTLYHESSIPIAPHESWLLFALGLFLLSAAVFGVARLYLWRRPNPKDYSFMHATGLCLLTMVMACACMVLLHRAFNIARYLKEDNPFSRYGMQTTEGEDDVRKLKLSAKIQLILLGVITIIITLYSAVATLFAFQFGFITAKRPGPVRAQASSHSGHQDGL